MLADSSDDLLTKYMDEQKQGGGDTSTASQGGDYKKYMDYQKYTKGQGGGDYKQYMNYQKYTKGQGGSQGGGDYKKYMDYQKYTKGQGGGDELNSTVALFDTG